MPPKAPDARARGEFGRFIPVLCTGRSNAPGAGRARDSGVGDLSRSAVTSEVAGLELPGAAAVDLAGDPDSSVHSSSDTFSDADSDTVASPAVHTPPVGDPVRLVADPIPLLIADVV